MEELVDKIVGHKMCNITVYSWSGYEMDKSPTIVQSILLFHAIIKDIEELLLTITRPLNKQKWLDTLNLLNNCHSRRIQFKE